MFAAADLAGSLTLAKMNLDWCLMSLRMNLAGSLTVAKMNLDWCLIKLTSFGL